MKKNNLKRNIISAVLVLVFILALTACSSAADTSTASQTPLASTVFEQPTFTLAELAMYDGQNGNPAYIAIDDVVYDVTDEPKWNGGKHNGYTAGQDLTEEMQAAPHGLSKLTGLTAVGRLAE